MSKRAAAVTPIRSEQVSELDRALHSLGAAGLLPRISELTVGPIKISLLAPVSTKKPEEPRRLTQEEHDEILFASADGGR